VLTALPARMLAVPPSDLFPYWTIVLNLLTSSLVGAWLASAPWTVQRWDAPLRARPDPVVLGVIAAATASSAPGIRE
jgi:uncharacterized protein